MGGGGGLEIWYTFRENIYFFTISGHRQTYQNNEQLCQRYQNFDFSVLKIGRIFPTCFSIIIFWLGD